MAEALGKVFKPQGIGALRQMRDDFAGITADVDENVVMIVDHKMKCWLDDHGYGENFHGMHVLVKDNAPRIIEHL
jgi:hypothetical protein